MSTWIKDHPAQWWALVGAVWVALGMYTVVDGSALGYGYIALGLIGWAVAAVTVIRGHRR